MFPCNNPFHHQINPRNLIIGCGQGYREDMQFPHNHQNCITADRDTEIQPDHLVDIANATPGQLQILTGSGFFREIYFENLFLADLQTARNVISLLAGGLSCVYYIGEFTFEDFCIISHVYSQLRFYVTYADDGTSQAVKEKLFPPQFIDSYGRNTQVIKATPRPLPSVDEAFGHLGN